MENKKIKQKIIRISDGLGNQMFQYAFILNFKIKGEKIKLDISQEEKMKQHNGFELKNIFNINDEFFSKKEKSKLLGPIFYRNDIDLHFLKILRKIIQIVTFKKYTPRFKHYVGEYETLKERCFNRDYLTLKNKKLYLQGFFQSYRYFNHMKDEVLKTFTFPKTRKEDSNNFELLEKVKNCESVSIHIRRGDYLKITPLNICNIDYYKKSFDFVLKELINRGINKEKIKLFIFSDDIKWCRENFNFLKNFDTYYIDWNRGNNSFKDMQLMSECKHNIIPNSTFSWWGAYLNKNKEKIVCAPDYWFLNIKTTYDRIPREWNIISIN